MDGVEMEQDDAAAQRSEKSAERFRRREVNVDFTRDKSADNRSKAIDIVKG